MNAGLFIYSSLVEGCWANCFTWDWDIISWAFSCFNILVDHRCWIDAKFLWTIWTLEHFEKTLFWSLWLNSENFIIKTWTRFILIAIKQGYHLCALYLLLTLIYIIIHIWRFKKEIWESFKQIWYLIKQAVVYFFAVV